MVGVMIVTWEEVGVVWLGGGQGRRHGWLNPSTALIYFSLVVFDILIDILTSNTIDN